MKKITEDQALQIVEHRANWYFTEYPQLKATPEKALRVYRLIACEMTMATAELAQQKTGFFNWSLTMISAATSVAWGHLVEFFEGVVYLSTGRAGRRMAMRRMMEDEGLRRAQSRRF